MILNIEKVSVTFLHHLHSTMNMSVHFFLLSTRTICANKVSFGCDSILICSHGAGRSYCTLICLDGFGLNQSSEVADHVCCTVLGLENEEVTHLKGGQSVLSSPCPDP